MWNDALEFIQFSAVFIGGVLVASALVFLALVFPLWLWGDRNVEELKQRAPAHLTTLGYEVIGLEGFTYGLFSQPGGCVWYALKRKENPQVNYTACVSRWHDGSLEVWDIRAVDALQGR